MENQKKCIRCQIEKPLSEFYKHPENRDGHQGACKACLKAYQVEHYRDHPELLEYSRRKLKRAGEILTRYKRMKGCLFCGERFPQALEMHHLSEKSSSLRKSRSFPRWTNRKKRHAELMRCIVVCANCHRKIHYGLIKLPDHRSG